MTGKKAVGGRKASPRPRSAPEAGYHHGDLQEALITAAEAILAEGGAEGFTLREAARRAGVSPAAPSHHFGNAPGLLTEVAIRGYDALTRALAEAAAIDAPVRERLRAQGEAYVCFALDHPGRFQMMFSNRRLLADEPRLHAAAKAAYMELEAVMEQLPGGGPVAARQVDIAARAAWSVVHGFAKLALEGKFGAADTAAGRSAIRTGLREVLDYLWPPPPRR
ncbi:TetR/AcrR family transcriptional regulator [Bradyrhizobium sp. 2TAF24]|uniref:TetR/AcrR family transcriptional regulator n=1 Tax=Bradyrhizobium sp. 2TAF24 TaxID=3233011 RepID=UPI003F93A972